MRAITARHSLFPRSPIHLSNRSPRGSPALAKPLAWADNWIYHVPAFADPNASGPIRLAPVYSPAALRRRTPISERSNLLRTILVRAYQPLWPALNHEVYRRFTSVAHAEFALPPRHITASSVVTPSPVATSFDGYVVPGASHPTVASRARPGRQLLVAQQVTAR